MQNTDDLIQVAVRSLEFSSWPPGRCSPPEVFPSSLFLMRSDGDGSARPTRTVTLVSGENLSVRGRPGGEGPRGLAPATAAPPPTPPTPSQVAEPFSPELRGVLLLSRGLELTFVEAAADEMPRGGG